MPSDSSLIKDPIFFTTVAVFALLLGGIGFALGSRLLLLGLQTVALALFVGMAVRRRSPRHALLILALWMLFQFAAFFSAAWVAPHQADRLVADGFLARAAFLEWFYTGAPLPNSLLTAPGPRLLELAAALAGSLLTGGLVGAWFLVRAVNQAAFLAAALLSGGTGPGALLSALPIWTLLYLAGLAGFVVLLAEPLLTGVWSPSYYLTVRRRLLAGAALLLLLGLLLELTLAPRWPALWSG